MGDWWIDESAPCPGPYQEPTLGELFAACIGAVNGTFLAFGKQFSKKAEQSDYILTSAIAESKIYIPGDPTYTALEEERDRAFAKADAAANVPSGTHKRYFAQFSEAQEQIKKREIGRGNVGGHGPRGKTTYGHNGRKRY